MNPLTLGDFFESLVYASALVLAEFLVSGWLIG